MQNQGNGDKAWSRETGPCGGQETCRGTASEYQLWEQRELCSLVVFRRGFKV